MSSTTVIMDYVASLLNDTQKSIFTYTVQLPYFNMAQRELEEELELNNVPVTNEVAEVITLPVGVTILNASSTPPIPPDLVIPRTLYERISGTNFTFLEMKQVEFLPVNQVPTAYLHFWSWISREIRFPSVSATSTLDIKIQYLKTIYADVIDPPTTDTPYGKPGIPFLTYRTAALCAEFIGENASRAQDLNNNAGLALARALGIATKGKQAITTRRRPFMASWRARRILW